MKKFLVLFNAPLAVMDEWMKNTPEERQKSMDEWRAWGEAHKDSLVTFGNPVGKNKRLTKDGLTEVRNEVGGYSIVQAESHEDAAKLFGDNPHLREAGTYIEIMELMEM